MVAHHQNLLVGFVKLIVSEDIARTSGTVAREAQRDKSPMNALLAECVRLCASMKIPLLVYGKFTYGRKGETSLTEFKKHNGFKKLEVPRYYIPLSARGRIGLRLGLHRSLIDVIPGPGDANALEIALKMVRPPGLRTDLRTLADTPDLPPAGSKCRSR